MPKKKLEKYEIESAADSLLRAKKIRNDKRLLKAALAELKRQAKAAEEALNDNNKGG